MTGRGTASTRSSPNIVLIMTDQQRADFTKADGYPLDTTPCIDELGTRGARFSRAYTAMPTCGPARCSMLTGRFPKATRVRENTGLHNIHAPADLPSFLREHGYSINISGKNHTYLRESDFDWASLYMHHGGGREDLRTAAHHEIDDWLRSLDHGSTSEPTPFPLQAQPAFRVVDDALTCLEQRDTVKPFFLWLSFAEPHNPYQVPEPYFGMFPESEIPDRIAGPDAAIARGGKWQWLRELTESKRPGYDDLWRRYRANYLGMLRLIDDQIGRFMSQLEDQGLVDSTMILFLSDHGDYAGDYGLQRKGVGLPECLIRVPLTIAGPGIVASESPREEFVSLVDIFPTICEMLGHPIPDGVQGRSLWPILSGDAFPEEEFRGIYAELGIGGVHYGVDERPPLRFTYESASFDELNSVSQSGNLKMVRMDRWKLLFDSQGRGELYDVESDPGELVNRFGDPDLVGTQLQLMTELLQWTIRTEDDLPGADYLRKRPDHNWYAPHARNDI